MKHALIILFTVNSICFVLSLIYNAPDYDIVDIKLNDNPKPSVIALQVEGNVSRSILRTTQINIAREIDEYYDIYKPVSQILILLNTLITFFVALNYLGITIRVRNSVGCRGTSSSSKGVHSGTRVE